jgi:galactose mutarotase-like enzyme
MDAMETISLENDLLEVKILPAFGGKITSIRSKQGGEEFMLPPLTSYRHASLHANFDQSDGGGFDECLPSVASCEAISGEAAVPDHGDLWRANWQVDSLDGDVVLHADSTSRPLRLTRRAKLVDSSLVLDYTLSNLSDSSATWLWSAHPLLRVEEGDLILLPDEIKQVSVEFCSTSQFRQSSCIEWPCARTLSHTTVDLSRVEASDGVTAYKLFAQMGKAGWASLYRRRTGQGLVFRFDPAVMPFLGLWICSGAWPECGDKKQYTIALEPATADFDSLAAAHRNGRAYSLGGRGSRHWRLEVQLLGASSPLSAEEFTRRCVRNITPSSAPALAR